MKGLLLKDLYLLRKHCAGYALAVAVFLVLALMGNDSTMAAIWPGALVVMIPIVLLQNDAQSKWDQYCGTLPYSKGQIVSAKYLVGLSTQVITLFLSGIVQAFITTQKDSVRWDIFLSKMSIAFILSFTMSSVSLPLVFRFGAEKGQILYAVLLGALCALFIPALMLLPYLMAQELPSAASLAALCLIAVIMYILSWCLSTRLYRISQTGSCQ